jgi:hypothetical protein
MRTALRNGRSDGRAIMNGRVFPSVAPNQPNADWKKNEGVREMSKARALTVRQRWVP